MIALRILLNAALFVQLAIAYILPRQTKSTSSNASTTSPPYPIITPSSGRSLGNTAAINYSVYGSKISSHIPNGTTVGVSIANGSTNAGINASLCFFVVQDTMNIKFWTEYTTSVNEFHFTVTSLIYGITQYIDTIITHSATSTRYTSNLSTVIESSAEYQPETENDAPGPVKEAEALNETVITSWGRTLTSPRPFYVYSTVKVLAVPAGTSSNGQLDCATATTSTYFNFDDEGTSSWPIFTQTILPSGNSKIYEYFEGDITSITATNLPTYPLKQKSALVVDIDATETAIVFATPYIYFPNLSYDNGFEEYGYIPQGLIDLIAQSPDITSSFPSYASFLPGGPDITFFRRPFQGLSSFTVTSAGCFQPDACQPLPPSTAFPTASVTKAFSPAITFKVAGDLGAAKKPSADSPPAIPVIKLDSLIIPANSALEFELGSQTLVPGGDPILHSSTAYSLAPSATAIFVNGLSSALIPATLQGLRPVVADGSGDLSHFADGSNLQIANNASPYVVGGQTVLPDSAPIIVSETTYSLDSSASVKFVNNIPSLLPKFEESRLQFAPVLSIGSQRITANAASEYILDGQTLSPAGSPIFISGTTYSLAGQASALIVNGVTSILPAYQPPNLPSGRILSIGSLQLTPDAKSDYTLDGQTLSPGGRPIVVSGTTYSLGPQASMLVVNGVTSILPAYQPPNLPSKRILSIGSLQLTADAKSNYILDGKTLSPGGRPTIVSGTTYSLDPQASMLVINGVTSILPAYQPSNLRSGRILSIGPLRLTADAKSDYILDGKTLSPGGRPIVVSGITYSLDPQASMLVINGVTRSLPAEQAAKPTPGPVIKIGSQYLTADAELRYAVASQTLIPNARPVVVSGTTYSLAPQATALFVNGVKTNLQEYETLPVALSKNTLPTNSQLDYIVGSQTLRPGAPAITISGTAISLAASGNAIVIGGSTFPFPTSLTAPSFPVGSQLITATAVSHSIADDEISRTATVTLSTIGSDSSPSSAEATSDVNGNNADPGPTSKSDASRGGLGLVSRVLEGVALGVLGLALL